MIRFVSATPRQVWLPFVFACLFMYPLISLGQGAAEFKESDRAAVEKLLDRYVRAYSAKDYAALRDCLQAPVVRFPEGGWELMGTLDPHGTSMEQGRPRGRFKFIGSPTLD